MKCPKIENAGAKCERLMFVILNLQICDIFVAAVVLLLKLPILSRRKNINFVFHKSEFYAYDGIIQKPVYEYIIFLLVSCRVSTNV